LKSCLHNIKKKLFLPNFHDWQGFEFFIIENIRNLVQSDDILKKKSSFVNFHTHIVDLKEE